VISVFLGVDHYPEMPPEYHPYVHEATREAAMTAFGRSWRRE